MRDVPSDSFRDGVLIYECDDPGLCPGGSVQGLTGSHTVPAGWYGLTPAEIAALDPLHIGPNLAAMDYFRQYPSPNEPGVRRCQHHGLPLRLPHREQVQHLRRPLGREPHRIGQPKPVRAVQRARRHHQRRGAVSGHASPSSQTLYTNFGLAIGHDWVLSDNLMNTFRYGFTQIDQGTSASERETTLISDSSTTYVPIDRSPARERPRSTTSSTR